MTILFNSILLYITIFFFSPLIASVEDNILESVEDKAFDSVSEPVKEDSYLEHSLQSTEPDLIIRQSIHLRKKGWVASLGTILGDNPYFCNSFLFTQLEYLPSLPMQYDSFSPMLSFRYLIADKKSQGFSIGGGTRFYVVPLYSVLGFNLFYDFKSITCTHFYQIGLGFEYLRFVNCVPLLELRTNFYLPLNKRFIVQATYCYYPEEFIATGKNTFYNPGGFEIEIGKRFFYKNFFDLYFSIAPYYLFGREYGIEYNGLFRWKSIAYAGIQWFQNITCSITDIVGIIGVNIPLDSETICEKYMPMRIPLSRWETIKLRSSVHWRTSY